MELFKRQILIIILGLITQFPTVQLCYVEFCIMDLGKWDTTFWPWSKADPYLHIDEMDSKENKKTCPFHETIQVSDVESYCFEKFAVTQSSCKMLEITVKDSDVVCDEDIGITYIGTHLLNDGTIKYCNIGNDGSYLKIIPSGGCRDYLT